MTSLGAPEGRPAPRAEGEVEVAMPQVAVLGTGGTIATVEHAEGASLRTCAELLAEVSGLEQIAAVRCSEVLRLPSQLMGQAEMAQVAQSAVEHARSPAVDGVVVLHGTDVLEETLFLTDLWHTGQTPIVFTGAQRSAGHPAPDGPANILDAVTVASSAEARGLGAVVCLGGTVQAASRAAKRDTASLDPFHGDAPPLGQVSGGRFRPAGVPGRRSRDASLRPRALEHRVELVRLASACDGALLRAASELGASGLVVEAFGAGTAPKDVVAAVEELVAGGIVVLLASRCDRGGVWRQDGPWASERIVQAGALPVGRLEGSKARIALLAALAEADGDGARAADLVRTWLDEAGWSSGW